MAFAVVQTEPALADSEPLVRAFAQVPFLTEQDAKFQVKNACGIVAQQLPRAHAEALAAALTAEGIGAAVIDESELLDLPSPHKLKRAACPPQQFVPADPLGRPRPGEFSSLVVLAAGVVPTFDFQRESRIVPVRAVGLHAYAAVYMVEVDIIETRGFALRLEILLDAEPLRYQVDAMRFAYETGSTGGRRDRREDFKRFVRDLFTVAPHCVLNRGAQSIIDGDRKVVAYRSRRLFEQEIVWLFWRSSHPAR